MTSHDDLFSHEGSREVGANFPSLPSPPKNREVKGSLGTSNFTSLPSPQEGSWEVKSPPLKGGKGHNFPSLPLHGGTPRLPSSQDLTELREEIAKYHGAVSRWCDLTGNAQAGESIAGARSIVSTKPARELAAFESHLHALAADRRKMEGEGGESWAF
jgi:hypothetical protein